MNFINNEIFDKVSTLENLKTLKLLEWRGFNVKKYKNVELFHVLDVLAIMFGNENMEIEDIYECQLEPDGYQELSMEDHFEKVWAVAYYLEREHSYIYVYVPGFKKLFKQLRINEINWLLNILKEMCSEKADLHDKLYDTDDYFKSDELFEGAGLLADENGETVGFKLHFVDYNPHDEFLLKQLPKHRFYHNQLIILYDALQELKRKYGGASVG